MLQQLTMRDLNILITLCLNLGWSLSKGVTSPCHGVEDGLCGRGQHVLFTEDSDFSCVDCPLGTYLDFPRHNCEACKSHSHPHLKEVVIDQGSTTHDNVIVCKDGFFKRQPHASKKRRVGCEKCLVCEDGTWEVQACSEEENTLCCQSGMVAGRQGGRLTCVLPHSRSPRDLGSLRKERSSDSNDNSSSVLADDSTDKAATSPDGGSNNQDRSDPSHSYSRSDYETEYRQKKVEFPVWARIIVAGVAVGVFLFYLGVGIPCNACGSRDKLRALKNWAFRRDVEAPTNEESKEKSQEKPKNSSDPV